MTCAAVQLCLPYIVSIDFWLYKIEVECPTCPIVDYGRNVCASLEGTKLAPLVAERLFLEHFHMTFCTHEEEVLARVKADRCR